MSSSHSRSLRLHRFVDGPETFFVTKSVHPKKPVLDEAAREIVVSALHFALDDERIFMGAFVVMPDHLHLLFALCESWTLPRFMHHMMSFIGARTYRQLNTIGAQWQDGYYDTLIRSGKQFTYVANYIEQNPVAKGLVKQPEQWTASSAHRRDLITDPWPWLYL